MGGLFHDPVRYSQEALRFLFILEKSFFPKLHICALHTRQPLALTKRLEQLGLFMQPRSDEFRSIPCREHAGLEKDRLPASPFHF
jgi:hypothetical protein